MKAPSSAVFPKGARITWKGGRNACPRGQTRHSASSIVSDRLSTCRGTVLSRGQAPTRTRGHACWKLHAVARERRELARCRTPLSEGGACRRHTSNLENAFCTAPKKLYGSPSSALRATCLSINPVTAMRSIASDTGFFRRRTQEHRDVHIKPHALYPKPPSISLSIGKRNGSSVVCFTSCKSPPNVVKPFNCSRDNCFPASLRKALVIFVRFRESILPRESSSESNTMPVDLSMIFHSRDFSARVLTGGACVRCSHDVISAPWTSKSPSDILTSFGCCKTSASAMLCPGPTVDGNVMTRERGFASCHGRSRVAPSASLAFLWCCHSHLLHTNPSEAVVPLFDRTLQRTQF
mmetsp:Transcript_55803/g.148814  ORF Transcript_55803/g.148814 Transcript_55803/m.148814 type:complete len:351 (-) Transcript_55803:833-1885(-)